MATPSKKTEGMERFIATMSGSDRRDSIKNDTCIPPPFGCGKPAKQFRDELSRREFSISGLCQNCQDKVFGKY